jgi:site-specific recombinase XerD
MTNLKTISAGGALIHHRIALRCPHLPRNAVRQTFHLERFWQLVPSAVQRCWPPHCSAYGLRKAGATIAADNGATAHQLMAIFGWTTIKQAEIYTKKADQKRLAGVATRLVPWLSFGLQYKFAD